MAWLIFTFGKTTMNTFYTLSSIAMVALLFIATGLFLAGRKRTGDWWLAAFFGSLVVNAIWAITGPILAGIESMRDQFEIGNLVSRLIALAGYCALVAFVIVRKQSSAL
jgi:hypothetical protein